MYNKVFKNYQVSIGNPFRISTPFHFNTVKTAEIIDSNEDEKVCRLSAADAEDIIEQARKEAELIIKEAQYEASRILENAQSELEQIRRAAEDEARRRGYEDGLRESKKQYEDLLREAQLIKESARVEYGKVISGIESDAVELVLDIARRVIGMELSSNRENVLHLVRQALDKCTNREKIILKVSSGDYEYVLENKERLLSMVEGISELEIKRDCSLKTGSCLVETQYGSIDAGAETKLKKIEEAFRQALGALI